MLPGAQLPVEDERRIRNLRRHRFLHDGPHGVWTVRRRFAAVLPPRRNDGAVVPGAGTDRRVPNHHLPLGQQRQRRGSATATTAASSCGGAERGLSRVFFFFGIRSRSDRFDPFCAMASAVYVHSLFFSLFPVALSVQASAPLLVRRAVCPRLRPSRPPSSARRRARRACARPPRAPLVIP